MILIVIKMQFLEKYSPSSSLSFSKSSILSALKYSSGLINFAYSKNYYLNIIFYCFIL